MKTIKVTPLRVVFFVVALVAFNTVTAGIWSSIQEGMKKKFAVAQQSFKAGYEEGSKGSLATGAQQKSP